MSAGNGGDTQDQSRAVADSANDDFSGPNRAAVMIALDEIQNDLWTNIIGEETFGATDAADAAVMFGYLHVAFPGQGFDEKARRSLDTALEGVASSPDLSPALHQGIVGVGWAVEHVERRIFGMRSGGTDALDASLCHALSRKEGLRNFDLVSGLAGIGIYALERGADGDSCLGYVIEQLAGTAVSDVGGTWWHTHPALVRRSRVDEYPFGYFNLGMAHGLAGVLPVLAGAVARGVKPACSRLLYEGAVQRLLGCDDQQSISSRFPGWIERGAERGRSRTGWCYGDGGVSRSLVASGEIVDDPTAIARGNAIAKSLVRRDPSTFEVVDASLCHGSAGLLHMVRRVPHADRDGAVASAIDYWLERTLAYRTPGRGGGFLYRFQQGYDGECHSLLEGTTGVGLALLSWAVPGVVPEWDAALGMSIRRYDVAISAERSHGQRELT